MDAILELLKTANSLSPLAVIGLLVTVVFMLVKKEPEHTTEVSHSDSHVLVEMSETMHQMATTLQRIEVGLAENFTYLKAKVNGGYGGPSGRP